MGDNLVLECYYWFDNQVRTNRFPNANTLAEQFGVPHTRGDEPDVRVPW